MTGSKIADIMKSGRKKDEVFSETAKTYLYQVAGERLFNPDFLNDDDIFQDYIDQVSVNTKAMQWGSDREGAAKSLFMQMNFPEGEITELSSCKHDTIPYFAASPDGAIYYGRDGEDLKIIEVKCPNHQYVYEVQNSHPRCRFAQRNRAKVLLADDGRDELYRRKRWDIYRILSLAVKAYSLG